MPTHILRSEHFLRPSAVLREAGIREGMRVVHFGCGPGFYAIPAAQFVGKNGRVAAIDVRTQALEEVSQRAKMERLENLDIFRGDVAREKGSLLPDDWADLVVLANILHMSDPRAVMTEAARIVRPETGRVLVVEWELVNIPLGPPVERRIHPNDILAAAKLSRLVLLRRWKPSRYHFAFLFARAAPDDAR